MRNSIKLMSGTALLATFIFHMAAVQAKTGENGDMIMAQGVVGAPQGGSTGTGGNGGVGSHDAGTERGQNYDNPGNSTAPNGNSSNSSPMNETTSPLSDTTSGGKNQMHKHHSKSMGDTTSSESGSSSGSSGYNSHP